MINYFEIKVGQRVEIGPAYSQDPRQTYVLDDFVGLSGHITAIQKDGFVKLSLDSDMTISIHAARLTEPQKPICIFLTPTGDQIWENTGIPGRNFREHLRSQCQEQAKHGDTCIIYSSTRKILDKWIK